MSGRDPETSFYELLEVDANASIEEIEASYHRIVSYMGPGALAVYSMIEDEEVDALRAQLDEAFRTLSDPERRAAYDRARAMNQSYPAVLVPESHAGSNLSVGVVRDARLAAPSSHAGINVDAIFRGEETAAEPPRPAGLMLAALAEEEHVQERPPASASLPTTRPPAISSDGAGEPDDAAGIDVEFDDVRPVARPTEPVEAPRPRPMPSTDSAVRELRREAARRLQPQSAKPRRLHPAAAAELTADTEFSGALLRRLRESCPADLDTVAEITKVRKAYLAAIEAHDFASLPAAVYVRGFVTEYARVLGLDPQRVAQSYMSVYKRYQGEGG